MYTESIDNAENIEVCMYSFIVYFSDHTTPTRAPTPRRLEPSLNILCTFLKNKTKQKENGWGGDVVLLALFT